MKRKMWGMAVLTALICMVCMTACSGQKTESTMIKTEGLERYGSICVVTREAGSGTRGVFAEALGLMSKSAQGSSTDLIVETGHVAMNAEAVIDTVKADPTAIGYVSLGALSEEASGIKVIKVAGVEAGADTVADGSYSLGRNFNLAYSGKPTEIMADFLAFVASEGQNIAAKNYTSVKEPSVFLSDQSKGEIKIAGSTSMTELMNELTAAYQQLNKNAEIEVSTTDSTSGLTAAMQGSCDLGMASRDLKDYEKELLTSVTIARDGIAVIVNEQNPVENLTTAQLADVFSGKDIEWSDINK